MKPDHVGIIMDTEQRKAVSLHQFDLWNKGCHQRLVAYTETASTYIAGRPNHYAATGKRSAKVVADGRVLTLSRGHCHFLETLTEIVVLTR